MPHTPIHEPRLSIGQPGTLVSANESLQPHIKIRPGTTVGDFVILGLLGQGGEALAVTCKERELNSEKATAEAPVMAIRLEIKPVVPKKDCEGTPETIENARKRTLDGLLRVKDCCQAFRGRPFFAETISMAGIYVGAGDKLSIQVRALMPCYRSNLYQLAHEHHHALTEPTLRSIMYQLLNAVDNMHSEGYCHGDLSGSNVFIDYALTHRFPDENVRVHVGDFGFARPCTGGLNDCADWLGTPVYRSPEALMKCKKSDRHKWDMWAVGIILFHLMTGRLLGYVHKQEPEPPQEHFFEYLKKKFGLKAATEWRDRDSSVKQLILYYTKLPITFKAVEMCQFGPDIEFWGNLSKYNFSNFLTWDSLCPKYSGKALTLLSALLQPNSDKRLSAREALQHPFFFTTPDVTP